ncbi:MAG: histidinol-phosphate transaminase [Flavobacteriaceae bacterium]|nr:histidinol-phosphate transaminase [Flavobacteriaceae bacterium]
MSQTKQKNDILNLVRPSVIELKPYASAKEEFKDFNKDMIFLDANENPYETEWNRYPDPNQNKLKKVISKIKGIDSKNIFLGNGSDEILDMVFRVFCEPSFDNIIINTPTFGMYKVLSDINNVTCKKVLLKNDFQLDIKKIIESVDERTKVLFICSPNNPTGNLIKKEDILTLLNNLNVIIVIDEAYIDFTFAESLLNEVNTYKNLIVTQTLSKAYGMAGLRLGICYANELIIELLKKIKMPYNVNILTQINTIKYLGDNTTIQNRITKIIRNKSKLREDLEKIEFVVKIYNSDTNFFLVQVDDANKRYKQLLDKGIIVRNRTNEPLCENCLRITVGTNEENTQLIKAFNKLNT